MFNLEQLLQVSRFLVSKIEQAVPRVMGMKAKFCTPSVLSTLGTHFEWLIASNAKLKLALKIIVFRQVQ